MAFSSFSSINRFIETRQTTAGQGGNILNFGYGTTNNCIAIGSSGKFLTSNGTWECWIRVPTSSTDDGWRGIININLRHSLVLYQRRLSIWVNHVGNYYQINTSPLNDNQWHHCACVWTTGGNTSIFLDGANKTTGSYGTPNNSAPIRFGSGAVSLQRCMFDIKNVYIYNQVLTDATILGRFQSGHLTAGPTSGNGLIGRFLLDEGTGSTLNNTASGSTEGNMSAYATTDTNNTGGGQQGTEPTILITGTTYWKQQ